MEVVQILPPAGPGFIRHLGPPDHVRGLALSTEAGWNQNEADWQLLTKVCLGRGVELGELGLVGTAMAWPLAGDHAWINMVLVTPEYRGRGLARALMEALLLELSKQGRTAFLDATAMGEGLYRKLGFRDGPQLVRLACDQPCWSVPVNNAGPGRPRLMQPADIARVAALDQAIFGLDRSELLLNFMSRCPRAAWVLVSADDELLGMVTARDGRNATQLGPLVAVDRQAAGQLLRQALAEIDGPVIIDVPAFDQAWLTEVKELGFVAKRNFNRMTRGDVVLATDWSRYFAISGPDFA
jgi:GNAT superfamily N-acetyltransferase